MIKKVQKDWGHEEWIVNNELYCFKKIFVKKNHRCSIHWHKNKDETFYIEKGELLIDMFGFPQLAMTKGDSLRILPNSLHRFTAVVDTTIYEISTHHEDSDSYRVISGGKCNYDK